MTMKKILTTVIALVEENHTGALFVAIVAVIPHVLLALMLLQILVFGCRAESHLSDATLAHCLDDPLAHLVHQRIDVFYMSHKF